MTGAGRLAVNGGGRIAADRGGVWYAGGREIGAARTGRTPPLAHLDRRPGAT